jgi:cold shock CspA family protein
MATRRSESPTISCCLSPNSVLAERNRLSHTGGMFYGVIKAITPHRGFGFIGHEGGLDVYFHAAEIGDDVFQRLTVNQPVKFAFAKRKRDEEPAEKKGPRAAKIELIARMPGGVMGFLPQNLAPHHHPRAKKRKATWKRRIDVRGNKKSGD